MGVLNEKEQLLFTQAFRKLMTQFIMAKQDYETYKFILAHERLFDEHLKLDLGCQLVIDRESRIIGIEDHPALEDANLRFSLRKKLKKTHTALLVCLWHLYFEKIKNFSDPTDVWFKISELKDLIRNWNLANKNLSASEIDEAFKLFSKANLIRVLSSDITNPESRVQIYPSIMLCIDETKLKDIAKEYEAEYGIKAAEAAAGAVEEGDSYVREEIN